MTTKPLTTAEAAALIGVTERRVRQLAGFLHADRDEFGRLLFDPAVVESYARGRHAIARTMTNSARIASLEERVAVVEERLGIPPHD